MDKKKYSTIYMLKYFFRFFFFFFNKLIKNNERIVWHTGVPSLSHNVKNKMNSFFVHRNRSNVIYIINFQSCFQSRNRFGRSLNILQCLYYKLMMQNDSILNGKRIDLCYFYFNKFNGEALLNKNVRTERKKE